MARQRAIHGAPAGVRLLPAPQAERLGDPSIFERILGNERAAGRRVDEGVEHFRAGRAAQAEACFRDALALSPSFAPAANNLAIALFARSRGMGEPAAVAACLREAVELKPDFAAAHCNLALALDDLGEAWQALETLRTAAALAPDNEEIRTNLRILASRAVPMWHFSMMNDADRNTAYEAAIREVVRPGMRVLDIGTGAGILALMAARAGAASVVTCEMSAPLAAKAAQIVARNGYADRIAVLARKSTELRVPADLPEPADALVSEIVSSDLIGEGLLETFEDARRLVKPGAPVIPRAAAVRAQLVSAEGLDPHVSAGTVCGFELGDFNEFRPLKVHAGEVDARFEAMSEPAEVFAFDLQHGTHFPGERRRVEMPVTRNGRCVGVLQWIRLQLSANACYENHPGAGVRRAGHWQQTLHLFAQPVELRAGETVALVAEHNRQNLFFRLEARPL